MKKNKEKERNNDKLKIEGTLDEVLKVSVPKKKEKESK